MSKPSSSSSSLLLFLIIITVTLSCVAGETLASGSYISGNSDDKNDDNAACDEIYVVKEGETLQTISDKCNDPFILEENTQINDFDDVFPGLVIKITSLTKSRKLLMKLL
ncbi:PREDICTED: uncharacterized protein LOC109155627 [Ipomoea nil]|uniref:uncharacterized protein LOC109155627 n=1 Tax=Ipomoea nil TaxID=35883 RepID=UPI000901361E|nr:PREDICTED: uncharacterized protein LOC109155627 [Ipomoea nil]